MKLKMVLLAALVAVSVSLPGTASAKIVSMVWTCNSDGWEHVVFTYADGTTQEWLTKECGPIAFGGGYNLLFSEETRVSERGQAFLDGLEAGEAISSTRDRVNQPIVTRDVDNLTTIYLRPEDVGPRLAAFFARIDRDWNGKLEAPISGFPADATFPRVAEDKVLDPASLDPAGEGLGGLTTGVENVEGVQPGLANCFPPMCMILVGDSWPLPPQPVGSKAPRVFQVPFGLFDQSGSLVSAKVLVPGDKGISVPLASAEGAPEMNARQSCRDQGGFWRQGSEREWGCWTTRR